MIEGMLNAFVVVGVLENLVAKRARDVQECFGYLLVCVVGILDLREGMSIGLLLWSLIS